LDNSLINLVNLKELNLYNFDQELDNSLDNLLNLEYLNMPAFNQYFGNSLMKLNKLKSLELDFYSNNLHRVFDNLINLKYLKIQPDRMLEDSLDKLINLEELDLINYRRYIDKSFKNLTKLKKLYLNEFAVFNFKSLDTLVNLEELTIETPEDDFHSHLILDCLKNLTNLKMLKLSCNIERTLDKEFDNLVNLKILHLPFYNNNLNDSLKNLTNLEELYLDIYELPLENMKYLTKLKKIKLGINYIKQYGMIDVTVLPPNLIKIEI